MVNWLHPPTKPLRSKIIAAHVIVSGYKGAVIFSCGNAAAALKAVLPATLVIAVAPGHELQAGRWWTPQQIHQTWPDHFDATSGHLPMPVMVQLAHALKTELGKLSEHTYHVPTGSGESVLCLRLAYPQHTFIAVYNDRNPSTTFDKEAPLNWLVANSGPVIRLP